MKKLLILILITLWAFVDAKAQSHYFLANSVEGVQIELSGSGNGLSGQYLKDTSEIASSQKLWFLAPAGYDPANGRYVRAGQLNVGFTNLTNVWKKITIYDFTGTTLIRSQNIAPNATLDWGFGTYPQEDKRLDASKDYYWKFENVASQTVTCNSDTKNMPASNYDYIDVLDNDLNLPSGSDCRLKAGQTLTGGLTVIKDQFRGLKVTTSSQQGSFSFIYEVVNNGSVLAEGTATIVVSAPSSSCTLVILSEQLQAGSQTIHEFTIYSPNAQINPFNYAVRTGSYQGSIVKSGVTPTATSNKEIIDFGILATGTYYVSFASSISNCIDFKTVFHINPTDACNASIVSIDKVNGTNNYSVNSSFSNVSSIKMYLTDAQISGGSPLLTQTGIATQSFSINLSSLPTGSYYVNIEGEGKYCKAQKTFEHTLVAISTGATKLETWTKFIHNYKDNWVISGKNDYESGRDKFGLQELNEKAQNVVWKSFISDFDNAGNSPKAKAIIGFRKDTTRNEVGVSVGVTANSIILQQRSAKSGATNILATVNGVTMPVWVRLTKTGNDFVADYSKDFSMNPVYTELGRVNGAFTGFANYQKYIGVASAKTDVIASARFQGQLGGTVIFDTPIITIAPPMIASNVVSPTSGQSVAFSTSTSCIAPSTNKWYKNSDVASFSAGATVNVQAYNGDSYYARCENGLNKSAKSNVIAFTIGNLASCNNSGSFTVGSAVYASGNVSFSFSASNLSNASWSILNGTTVTKSGTVQPSSSTQTISSGTLLAGNYIFKLDGVSCSGSAQKAFIVEGSSSAPSVVCSPSSPVAGDNITLTASGCAGFYNWFVSNATQPYATNNGTSSVSAVTGGSYYYATCQGSVSPSNYINVGSVKTGAVNVFVFVGESNAGTRNGSSTLASGEGGIRSGVRIWNNNTNQLEPLNVGTNNYLAENESIVGGWGWEVELANLRANGTLNSDFVIVKTAQGGALIGQYNTDITDGYYSKLASRVNAVRSALQAEGKTPIFHVMYSQGINNALYPNISDQGHFPNQSGIDYWQSATTTMLSNLRSLMGLGTKISMMKFFGDYGTYLNGAVQNIVNQNSLNSFVTTTDLGIQGDGLHIGASGTRTITDRYITQLNVSSNPVDENTNKPNAPTLSSNVSNPTAGQSITLTSTGCASGLTNQFFANNTLIGSGNSISLTANSETVYSAKCVALCESLPASVYVTVTSGTGGSTCNDGQSYPVASSSLKGNVEYGAPQCNSVDGWALDVNNSATEVVVDIYIGGYFVISTTANLGVRDDIASVYGSGYKYKQFRVNLPTATNAWWKNGTNKKLEVKFGGTRTNLENGSGEFTINCAGTGSGVCN